jgi:DNA repair exonuclease SbcCD ATPase subunit
MRTYGISALAALAVLSSCGTKEKLEQAQEQNTALNTELQATLATQDSLFALINDITTGMNQIKDIEHIIATPGALTDESSSRKTQLRNDMVAIREALQQRRERLAQLEAKLKESNGSNATLLKTIDNLKGQIAEQETEIATLTNQLSAAHVEIAALGARVDSLSTTVTEVTTEREEARQQATELTDELNTCFFAIGTKGELQQHQIIKTGFLRKTKILPGDFERTYFTQADKRSLVNIPLHSKKAKVLTNQPADSYEIVEEGNQKILKIKDAAKFWSISNFLVIQVD